MDFRKFSRLIMVEQTLFALPFAYLGVLFAGGGTLEVWWWVTLALAAARTAGMSFNRVIDARIDAKNPRTRDRLLPRGEVTPFSVWVTAAVSSLLLVGAAYMLNPLCFILSFPSVGLLFIYSYTKRFTAASHFCLGTVEAVAPLGGYLGVTGEFALLPFLLGFVILAWIAGLDILYALQDMEFDISEKLHSVPSRLGRGAALAISAACYLAATGAMVAAGALGGMNAPYYASVAAVCLIFLYQQRVARGGQEKGWMERIFVANMFISPVLLAGTGIAVLTR